MIVAVFQVEPDEAFKGRLLYIYQSVPEILTVYIYR